MSNHSDRDSFPEDIDEEDIDEDEILANLSPEELRQLQSEMDVIAPDELVPVGQRQKDQTEKTPTGTFDHRSLVDYLYWEKESKRMMEEERVPATLLPSQKNMKEDDPEPASKQQEDVEYVYEVVEEVIEEEPSDGVKGEEVIEEIIEEIVEVEEEEVEGKEDVEEMEVQVKGEESIKQPEIVNEHQTTGRSKDGPSGDQSAHTENTNVVPQSPLKSEDFKEERETEGSEPQADTNGISSPAPRVTEHVPGEQKADESYNAPQKEERKINKLNIPKLALGGIKLTSRPSGNDTNLDTTLDKIRNNNPAITEVNLNNIENIPKEMLVDYVNALKRNKHVKTFSIANTGADENIAFILANMLRENRSITTLNIESNFITGKGIVAIIRCLQFNETLTELRFHNQRHMLGHHAEMEVSRLLKANHTLLKMGYHFEQAGPRMVVTNLLTRNLDHHRQLRHEDQKQQQLKEQKEAIQMYENSLNLPPGLLEMLGYVPPIEFLQQQGILPPPPPPQQPGSSPSAPRRQADAPPQQVRNQLRHSSKHSAIPQPPGTDQPASPLQGIQLKRTPKRRDPFLELDPREDRRPERASFQLRKTPRPREAGSGVMADERANLKDVIKTLKPVPRRREPAKVDLTPRDHLLNEIRQSNVAYLKATPLPKMLESEETSLF